MKKYKLLKNNFIIYNGIKLYRIQALKNFGDVKKGDIGGYIQYHKNLSHMHNCWIYNEAKVYENAYVHGNAKVYENAKVHGNAEVYDNAMVYRNAEVYENVKVYENAHVYGNSYVYGNAKIYGDSWVYENTYIYRSAKVYGNARVYRSAKVYDNARVYGNAQVYGSAKVYDNASVYGNAYVYENAYIFGNAKVYGSAKVYGTAEVYNTAEIYETVIIRYGCVKQDVLSDMQKLIYNTFGIVPDKKGNYIFYKHVDKISDTKFSSIYDSNFIYEIGKFSKVKNYNKNKKVSCSTGLHVSNLQYRFNGTSVIQVQVNIKDIITCLGGKIRCKKLKVLREVKNEEIC